jgi:diguanylate cyclase (GGDEF)-like protein
MTGHKKAAMFSLFPKNDPLQELRIRRFLIGAASYLMWMALIIYCHYHGFIRMSGKNTTIIFGLFLLIQFLFYIFLRFGGNKRLSDPSLTMLQMLVAAVGAMIVIYYTDVVRGVMLLAYIVTILFGVFRFTFRQYILFTLFSIAGYAFVISQLMNNHPENINLKIELLQWVVLSVLLFWSSIFGAYISGLRQRNADANRELKKAFNTIQELAIHDDLTKAYNRRYLFDELHRQKAVADRGRALFSIVLFDLDHFKTVNDIYGHLKGDDILKHLIQALKHEIREGDCLARYGGEEFIIVLAHTNMKEAEECAERIRKTAEKLKFPGVPDSFGITVSIGVTAYNPNESIERLISRADAALYRAKSAGRNQVITEYPEAIY